MQRELSGQEGWDEKHHDTCRDTSHQSKLRGISYQKCERGAKQIDRK
jgi:hypothetical protein